MALKFREYKTDKELQPNYHIHAIFDIRSFRQKSKKQQCQNTTCVNASSRRTLFITRRVEVDDTLSNL
jgi:hypothetical protein